MVGSSFVDRYLKRPRSIDNKLPRNYSESMRESKKGAKMVQNELEILEYSNYHGYECSYGKSRFSAFLDSIDQLGRIRYDTGN